jgi:putative intracellular protease/amidase
MVDLHNNQNLGYIIHHFHRHNKPTGMICHGPIALLSVHLAIPMGSYTSTVAVARATTHA